MTWFTRQVIAALFVSAVFVTIGLPSAHAQLAPTCTQINSNPIKTSCTFLTIRPQDYGFWIMATTPVPGNSYVDPDYPQPFDQTCYWPNDGNEYNSPTCVTDTVQVIVTLTDPDAGDKIPGPNGAVHGYGIFQALFIANCGSGIQPPPLIIDTYYDGKVKSKSFIFKMGAHGQITCAVSPGYFDDNLGTNSLTGCDQPPCAYPDLPKDAVAQILWAMGTPWTAPEMKQAMSIASDLVTIIGAGVASVAFKFKALAKPAVGAATAAAGSGFVIASKRDPPDLNYTVVVTPTPPNIDLSAELSAAQQLIQAEEQAIGFLNAIITTTNRATGAFLSGDTNSLQLQRSALPGFESQLAGVVAQLPPLFAAWGQELLSQGADPRAVTLADVIAFQQSIVTNGLPSDFLAVLTALGADQDTIQQVSNGMSTADAGRVVGVPQNLFQVGPLMPPVLPASTNLQAYAAVLPASRSVQVGSPATAFATIINAGTGTAKSCGIAPASPLQLDFSYQTTDPATNTLTGRANTPADIAPGAAQTFLIVYTRTTAELPALPVQSAFFCANANVAPNFSGVDTLLLSASTDPVPDAITVGLTPSRDGYSHTGGPSGTGLFVIASTNIGISASLTAQVKLSNSSVPLTALICQTDPTTGLCLAPPQPTVTATINQNQNTTWSAFLQANGTIPQDPANNRAIFQFVDSNGVVRGATSTAVTTQ